jgi:hypothetical protein
MRDYRTPIFSDVFVTLSRDLLHTARTVQADARDVTARAIEAQLEAQEMRCRAREIRQGCTTVNRRPTGTQSDSCLSD